MTTRQDAATPDLVLGLEDRCDSCGASPARYHPAEGSWLCYGEDARGCAERAMRQLMDPLPEDPCNGLPASLLPDSVRSADRAIEIDPSCWDYDIFPP